MTFDLIVWPVDRALTLEEAVADVDRLRGTRSFGLGHDRRLDAFVAAMETRHPDLRGRGAMPPPFELHVHRRHIVLGVPWSEAETVARDVAAAAWASGLAVYDPQRRVVGLPAPFADAPMTTDGLEGDAQAAAPDPGAIRPGGSSAAGGGRTAVRRARAKGRRAVSGQLAAAGAHETSPLGYEVTPEVEAELRADPLRVPSSLQTPERRRQLIADMTSPTPGARHAAIGQLAGWDPDPEVASALRTVLASDDVVEAGLAAGGLARQGDITDLPAVLDLVHRMSPADGGSTEAMLAPLRAALDLASLAGPMAIDGVKARARSWRGDRRVRRQSWEHEFDRDLDELLGEG